MIPTLYPSETFEPERIAPPEHSNWLGHLPFAADLISHLRPGLIVELGTHYGESYFGLCQAVAQAAVEARCSAVDTWSGDSHAGFYGGEVFADVDAHNRCRYDQFSHLLRSTFDDALDAFADESISLLHIDGLHTYEAVSRDFSRWFPKVCPGGIIMLHDTAARHADFGVWRLWTELERNFPSIEFHHCWGLGVLQKPGRSVFELLAADDQEKARAREYYERCAARLAQHVSATRSTVRLYVPDGAGAVHPIGTAVRIRTDVWTEACLRFDGKSARAMLELAPCDGPGLIEIAELSWSGSDSAAIRLNLRAVAVEGTAVGIGEEDGLKLVSFGAEPRVRITGGPYPPALVTLRAVIRVRRDAAAFPPELKRMAEAAASAPRLQIELARLDEQRLFAMRSAADSERDCAALLAEVGRQRATMEQLQARVQSLEVSRSVMLKSWSWRLTSPLRSIGACLNRR